MEQARSAEASRGLIISAGAGDGSIVWPDDRKRVETGTLKLTAIAPNNAEAQRSLALRPIYLTEGIQLSDDQFPALRAAVYALSTQHRGN